MSVSNDDIEKAGRVVASCTNHLQLEVARKYVNNLSKKSNLTVADIISAKSFRRSFNTYQRELPNV